MKILQNIVFTALLFVTLFSCKKEAAITSGASISTQNVDDIGVNSLSCRLNPWQGFYAKQGQATTQVADNSFILNGIARLSNSPFTGDFYTSIKIPLTLYPYCLHSLAGDNVTVEVNLKNPNGVVGSVYANDVSLILTGLNNVATVTYIGSVARQSYTKLAVGNIGVTNDPSLIYLFSNYTTLKLVVKNNSLSTYINGILKKTINFNGTIGSITDMNIFFKGAGSIDWIKCYDSQTNFLQMEEYFDINNQANQHWHYPQGL